MIQNARLAGITSGYLSQLLSGMRHPSPGTCKRPQKMLGLTRFENLLVLVRADE